jgi:hypothetical protein
MTEKQRANREKQTFKELLRDFQVWLFVQSKKDKRLQELGEDELADLYLDSMWYDIHRETYLNEQTN